MPEEKLDFFGDKRINEEARLGRAYRDRPSGALRPIATRPASGVADLIANALIGASSGLQASQQVNSLGNPALSALAGAGGALAAPRIQDIRAQREAQLAQAQLQALDMTPVDQVSPALVEKFPELAGLPLGAINRIAPILQRQDQLEQAFAMFQAREASATEREKLKAEIRKEIEEGRRSERGERAQFTQERQLREEQRALSKDFTDVRDSFARIKEVSKNPTPAGDIALIFNYMKLLDPGSVVRESEFRTAALAGSYGQRVQAAVERAVSGKLLEDIQRTDFINRAEDLYNAQLATQRRQEERYRNLSGSYGLDTGRTVPDIALPDSSAVLRRMARPKGSTGEPRPYISTDGGRTWRLE